MVEQDKQLPTASLKDRFLHTRLERLEKISGASKGVITHEVLHWVAGYMNGFEADISFNPAGSSLARTMFYSRMDSKTISHVLAASSVEIHGYQPFGYGMDRLMLEYYSYQGGDNLAQAKSAAFGLFQGFGLDVLQRGIEIMTYQSLRQKVFSHNEIVSIFNQAKDELIFEGKMEYLDWKLEAKPEEEITADQDMTIFDTGQHGQSITTIKNGLLEDRTEICGICGGLNGMHVEERHREEDEKVSQKFAGPQRVKRSIPKIEMVVSETEETGVNG